MQLVVVSHSHWVALENETKLGAAAPKLILHKSENLKSWSSTQEATMSRAPLPDPKTSAISGSYMHTESDIGAPPKPLHHNTTTEKQTDHVPSPLNVRSMPRDENRGKVDLLSIQRRDQISSLLKDGNIRTCVHVVGHRCVYAECARTDFVLFFCW
jgi:hypothetical protein